MLSCTVKIYVSIQHAAQKDLCAAVRVDFTRMRVIEIKTMRICVYRKNNNKNNSNKTKS
jgi:hypothetical protein